MLAVAAAGASLSTHTRAARVGLEEGVMGGFLSLLRALPILAVVVVGLVKISATPKMVQPEAPVLSLSAMQAHSAEQAEP
jgi:hypothetical protein